MEDRSATRGDEDDTPLQEVVAGVVIGLILLTAFTLLALGYPFFWVVFPVGFAGVLPAALGLTKLYERRKRRERDDPDPADETETALETLRRRYATGEIDEEEFERRVERLLGTETVADAGDYVREARERERVRESEF